MGASVKKASGSLHDANENVVSVEILETTQEFRQLEAEWGELFAHCARATPFQSWAWLFSWWEYYGSEDALRLLVVRRRALIIGLAPLMLARRFAFSRLIFIGTGVTDKLDILVRDGDRDAFVHSAIEALDELPSWLIVDLHQVRQQAAVWDLVDAWRRPKVAVWEDYEPTIAVQDRDCILANLSSNHRSTLRRTLRRVEEAGITQSFATEEEAENVGAELVQLHRGLWEGRPIAPEHKTMRFESLLRTAARRLTAARLGAISQLCDNGRIVLASFLIFDRDQVGTYLHGASRVAASQLQVGSLYIWGALNVAIERRASAVSLLRGAEPYKRRWRPQIMANHRIVIGRNWLVWAPYAMVACIYSRARQYVHSDEAPGWFLALASFYRSFARAWRRLKADRL